MSEAKTAVSGSTFSNATRTYFPAPLRRSEMPTSMSSLTEGAAPRVVKCGLLQAKPKKRFECLNMDEMLRGQRLGREGLHDGRRRG